MEYERMEKKKPSRRGADTSDKMKNQFERLSGYSFANVCIHYNSAKPALFDALGYTQGNDVYLGPGQEGFLGHELGHVVQQKRGGVSATGRQGGVDINDDPALEKEADRLSRQAMQMKPEEDAVPTLKTPPSPFFRNVVQLEKEEPPKTRVPYTGDDVRYAQGMDMLRRIRDSGEELTERETEQLNTFDSNAQLIRKFIQDMQNNPALDAREWEAALEQFRLNAGHSVFTRDINQGELIGQPKSGGTMPTTERIKRGYGSIRTYKDLNRGGGGGSYVRFVAEKKKDEPGKESNPLNTGSIAIKSGVTIIYDAVSIADDNRAPADMAFNRQDSAGRIFGTAASTQAELRRNSRLSRDILAMANPHYPFPVAPRSEIPPLAPEYVMENAVTGLREMTRQASEGQTPSEEYNEAILFSGAKLSSIKAILIHTPIAPTGHGPVRMEFSERQITRQQNKRQQMKDEIESEISRLNTRCREIDSSVREIRSRRDVPGEAEQIRTERRRRNTEEIRELEGEKSGILPKRDEQKRKLGSLPKVLSHVFVSRPEVSTDTSVRSDFLFEKAQLPESLRSWYDQIGYGGVPIRYLFYHINPSSIRRRDLPILADEIWQKGYTKWKEQLIIEGRRRELAAQQKEDVEKLHVTGHSVQDSSLSMVSSPDKSTAKSNERENEDPSLLNVNNCLINAISMAARGTPPRPEEILRIRRGLLRFGIPFGEMLFASERIVRLILNELNIRACVNVHYLLLETETFFGEDRSHGEIDIYHYGAHFSENPTVFR